MSGNRFFTRGVDRLSKLSPAAAILIGVVLLLGCVSLDWVIPPQIALSVIYLVPVSWTTWKLGRWPGVTAAVICGIAWLVVDLSTNRSYTNELVPFWNGFVRIVFFSLVSGLEAEVLERRRAQEQLRRANDDLQKQTGVLQSVLNTMAEVSDREQRRLGEDLHDGLCQHLVSTALAARTLAAKLADHSLPEAEDAAEIAELLAQSISQARTVARGLYLVPLEAGGLASALEEFACQIHSRYRIRCQVVDLVSVPILGETLVTNLFRIAQEAMNNAAKHAKPGHIIVTLFADDQQIRLQVEDDGTGFRPDSQTSSGMGLHIMNYRAQRLGAQLKVTPRGDGGTLLACSLPRSATRSNYQPTTPPPHQSTNSPNHHSTSPSPPHAGIIQPDQIHDLSRR